MRRLSNKRGFTLLEMVVVIVLVGLLAKLTTPLIVLSLQANGSILASAVGNDKLRFASDRLAFEMRELTAGSITTASATQFAFTRQDYAPTSSPRTVTIDQKLANIVVSGLVSTNLCDGQVLLSYNTTFTPAYTPLLSDQMCSLTFVYYDMAGAQTTVPANVRYVEFTLAVQATTNSQRTRVALRSR